VKKIKPKVALISVSDKTGIVEFAKELELLEIEIIATGGTSKLLIENKIKVTKVEDYTNFPEVLNGRVKTLHPKIFAGILAIRNDKSHIEQLIEKNIKPIDLVVVNLYPFEQTVSKNPKLQDAIEDIDIGGVSLIRAAAKNYESVAVIVDPNDYKNVIERIKQDNIGLADLKEFCVKAFRRVTNYDAAIDKYLSKGKPAYVFYEGPTPQKAIEAILLAKGIPVIAHPGYYVSEATILALAKLGLQGIEAYYPKHSPEQIKAFVELAKKHDLVTTGGSDYHGPGSGHEGLGQNEVPLDSVEKLCNRKQKLFG